MIRAEEILGQIRPPVWRGQTRIVGEAKAETARGIAEAVEKRRAAAEIKRKARLRERPMWVEIGAALQAARKRRREQRKVTAHRIDTTPTSLDNYEAGARAIPERCWPKVLDAYGIDIAAMVAEWRAAQ